MARRGSPGTPEVPASILPAQAAQLIRKQIERGRALLEKQPLPDTEREAWQTAIHDLLERAFGSHNVNVWSVRMAGWIEHGRMRAFGEREPDKRNEEPLHREAVTRQITFLEGCAQQLEDRLRVTQSSALVQSSPTVGRGVFVVHGHDEAVREAAARLLSQLGLDPIILHEQPNKGRTIIEKFEDYSSVGFAVVLLTPDDRGGPGEEPVETQRPRARQNVWLELGFFLGKLGRSNVCVLYRKGVEIPSDYQGVVLLELDAGGAWKYRLAEELKVAGYQVDMNRVR